MKTTVVIADTHTAVRQLLGRFLEQEHDCTVTGEASTGHSAIKICRAAKPGLLVLGLTLSELNGVEVIRTVRSELRETRILVFCSTPNQRLALEALEAKPHGFVHKAETLEVFSEAVRAVLRGCRYFTPHATRLLDEASISEPGRPQSRTGPALTACERCVLQMVVESLTTKEIAQRMGVSPKTVDHYRASLMRKTGVHNVAGLIRFAMKQGMIELEEDPTQK